MKIEDKAYFAMEPNLQGMKKVRDEIYRLAQIHLELSEKSTDSQKKYRGSAIAQALSSFVNRAPYAAEIGMESKGSAYWYKKAVQLAKEGAAYGVIADKLIAEALSIYNSHSKPVEDKAYFDRRIYHSTGTFQTKLDKETRVPIDGTSKFVTVDPAQYITPRRVRISGIKGEIEIAAQLSGDEIKGISAKSVKATAARQGSKAKFANFKVGQIVKYKNPNLDEDPNQKYIIKEVNGDRGFMETHGGYFKDATFPPRMLYQQNEIMLASRAGIKSRFATDTDYAHKNTIKIKGKSDKIYALIYAEEGYGDNLTGIWNGHVQNNTNPKVNDIVTIGQFKTKEAAKAAAIKALKQEEQNANFSKSKFANRGAFAEASSSPVLGSLLEKKVMPEGGWRAVETDGGALVIAFEDGDIAGNFARRAAENGYSATAPMAMAGRFWNVKVQNENKN